MIVGLPRSLLGVIVMVLHHWGMLVRLAMLTVQGRRKLRVQAAPVMESEILDHLRMRPSELTAKTSTSKRTPKDVGTSRSAAPPDWLRTLIREDTPRLLAVPQLSKRGLMYLVVVLNNREVIA